MFFAEIHCFHGPLVKISPTAYRSTGWLCLYKDCSVIDVCARVRVLFLVVGCVCVWGMCGLESGVKF